MTPAFRRMPDARMERNLSTSLADVLTRRSRTAMGAIQFLTAAATALWRERVSGRDAVLAVQERRFRQLLQHAVVHAPLYRRIYAGLDVATVPLQGLPSISKTVLMEHFNESVSDGVVTLEQAKAFALDRTRVEDLVGGTMMLSMTSGTTGHVGYFLTDHPTWERLRGTLFGRLLRHVIINPLKVLSHGPWNRYRMGFVTATGGHYITYKLSVRNPLLASFTMKLEAFSILTPLPELCSKLNAFKPHFLHGYPTFMEALAHEQLAGRLHISPQFVSLGSEPFTQSAKAALQAAFPQSQIAETYGTTECVAIASTCRHGKLHVNEDIVILESVDAQGKAVPDGKLGTRVFLTNLLNKAQPLIRYEVGDQVVIHPPGCACGSPLKVLKVLGRSDDTFYLKGEDSRFHAHTPVPFEVLFLEVDGLRQWQLVHETQNALRVYFTMEPGEDPAFVEQQLTDKFKLYLGQNGLGSTVTVTLERTSEIPRDPNSKKIRQIVSRVPVPTNADELSGPWRLRGYASPSDG